MYSNEVVVSGNVSGNAVASRSHEHVDVVTLEDTLVEHEVTNAWVTELTFEVSASRKAKTVTSASVVAVHHTTENAVDIAMSLVEILVVVAVAMEVRVGARAILLNPLSNARSILVDLDELRVDGVLDMGIDVAVQGLQIVVELTYSHSDGALDEAVVVGNS